MKHVIVKVEDDSDAELVERGLCETREKAKRAILAGAVRVNQQVARKPSDAINPSSRTTSSNQSVP